MNYPFEQKIIGLWGHEGEEWLRRIPQLISTYEKKWNITVGEPFKLSYNYTVSAVHADGKQVVLKIGYPGNKEFSSEIEALRIFNGNSTVQLREENKNDSIILLDRAVPGLTLDKLYNNELETKIAAKLLKNLWIEAPENEELLTLELWSKEFERIRSKFNGNFLVPEDLYRKGELLFQQLLETTKEKKLLHGDFHHHNILLSQEDEWITIDPKGVIGDPAYDVSVFLYNPLPLILDNGEVKDMVRRRIDIFSEELDIDKQRIIDWGIAQSLLSSAWMLEDQDKEWEYGVKFARLLLSL